jgi:hypothetical protein
MQQMNPLLGGIINPNMRFVRDQCKENRRPKNGFSSPSVRQMAAPLTVQVNAIQREEEKETQMKYMGAPAYC